MPPPSPSPNQCDDLDPVAGPEGLFCMPGARDHGLIDFNGHVARFDAQLGQQLGNGGSRRNVALATVEFHR